MSLQLPNHLKAEDRISDLRKRFNIRLCRFTKELTDARMAVQYSEFFDQQSIVEAVEAALHNDVRARMLSAEMAALNGLLGRKSALNEAAKAVAQDIVQRQKLKIFDRMYVHKMMLV